MSYLNYDICQRIYMLASKADHTKTVLVELKSESANFESTPQLIFYFIFIFTLATETPCSKFVLLSW